jgi:AraC family transcriptional regulator of adaptative response/methylated-DNA-[protein]-cysteine methyltransferase
MAALSLAHMNTAIASAHGFSFAFGEANTHAAGNAVASNPIACLVPCHRMIRETGDFGNYRWGEPRKAARLGWEAAYAGRAASNAARRRT